MSDTNTSKKQPQKHPKKQSQNVSSSPSPSPKDPLEDPTDKPTPPQTSPAAVTANFLSSPLYIPTGVPSSSSPFDSQNSKRPRYTQWKALPNPVPHQQVGVLSPVAAQALLVAPSSSDTASSGGGHEQEREAQALAQAQLRKGKFVSPVWKPNEMLWLARAWKAQYQGGSAIDDAGVADLAVPPGRGKTRADKDREVAEFLNRHGITRDAKTAGTKWDNMLGEFRKVYEWERGGEREAVGKSYFRLSPYERKIHRLPASFDEDVFEELAQFMGARMRTPQQSRSGGGGGYFSGGDETRSGTMVVAKTLPPPLFRDEEFLLSGPSPSTNPKELRRIGKVRMIWEESVSLWAEEGEQHRGRVKLQGSNFLNADELIFLDDSMVGSTMESFEGGTYKGFSIDRFVSGQQVKVFGRRKSYLAASGPNERSQVHYVDQPSMRSISPILEFQDPTENYLGFLRGTQSTLPTLFELSWLLQEPPSEEYRFPLRKDVYKDLPQGKELFFSTSSDLLDCRAITFDLLSSINRTHPEISSCTPSSRDSFIGLWDDCINRAVSKFCPVEMVLVRKPSLNSSENIQDQWPNVTGFIRNFCLWRGEEIDQLREGRNDPSSSIVDKLLWTYMDLPYILGYYAIGHMVTFCALSRLQDRIIRTDLYTLDLSVSSERLKALVPCWRIASLLPLLADKCVSIITNIISTNIVKQIPFSDFEIIKLGKGDIIEMTPNYVTIYYSSKRKWVAAKEIYDYLDRRIPHAEYILRSSEDDMAIMFKPRGVKLKPLNCEELVEALKHVTKALVALHDISFMHRGLNWDKVMRRSDREGEWFVTGFEEAIGAPQLNPHAPAVEARGPNIVNVMKEQPKTGSARGGAWEARGGLAPEMGRGLHGVKVDVWGVGHLVMSCGLARVPEMLRELGSRCLEGNPEQRPTAADCYHHLLQLQSSMSGGGGY